MDNINEKKYKIRYLDIIPYKNGDEDIFIIRDPLMYSQDSLSVSPLGYVVIACMNGINTIDDIIQYILINYKINVNPEQIMEIIEALDKAYFLDNERFYTIKNQVDTDFRNQKLRRPVHYGISYPDKPQDIMSEFDSYFNGDFGGNGKPNHNSHTSAKDVVEALIIPHIDLRIGGKVYADAYREIIPFLKNYQRFIIFGTSHHAPFNLFALTEKDFETPLGTIETDKEAVDKLNKALYYNGMEDEIVHRTEHSIEFQTVFLKYLQTKYDLHDFKIVPILIGSFMTIVREGKIPEDYKDFVNFANTIKQLHDDKTCIIASVDLAHVGKKFGDAEGLSSDFLEYVHKGDMSMMEAIKRSDYKAFWDSIVSDNDKRKVCGFSPIYTLLKILNGKTARKSSYDKNIEEMTESMVSYAGVAF
jgi:MEMO1 family protein